MVDNEKMAALATKAWEADVARLMGSDGLRLLKRLGPFLRRFYGEKAPETVAAPFAVICCEDTPKFLDPAAAGSSRAEHLHQALQFPAIVQMVSENQFLYWNNTQALEAELKRSGALCYLLTPHDELVIAAGEALDLPNPQLNTRSLFSTPTFWELEDALQDYHHKVAKLSFDLDHLWLEPQRLRWKPAPEHALRDSLWRCIRLSLRGADAVKRERATTDTNPADIEVTWKHSTAKGLIEIKWLGISVEAGKITSNHKNKRAVEGAQQLRDYVRDSRTEDVDCDYVGYLVIFDGRRGRVGNLSAMIGSVHAWAYRDKEITYPDDILKNVALKVADFRFFMEPAI